MSSVTGIGVRSRSGGSAMERARARLAAILAAASAAQQLPLLRAGAALVLLGVCLEGGADPGRVALSGCAGLLALSLALFRDPRSRLLFGVSAFALVVCYAWTFLELADVEHWSRPSGALTPIAAILRELVRAWLVGMVVLASGVVLRGPSRLLTGSSDWLAPPFLGPGLTGLLAVVAVATGSWDASGLVGRAPHDAASAVALFQARLLASGRLAAAAPALT